MALLETFDEKNLVLSQGLAIRYNTRRTGSSYTLTRYATKSYSFVGLSLDAAKRCRDEKRALYTRDVVSVRAESYRDFIDQRLTADISIRPQGADAYRVDISVSEQDSRRVNREYESLNINPADVFKLENLREYDESYPLEIYGVSRRDASTLAFSVRYKSPDVNPSLMRAYYQDLETIYTGSDWTNVECVADVHGNVLVTVGRSINPRAFKFRAGAFESNVFAVPGNV